MNVKILPVNANTVCLGEDKYAQRSLVMRNAIVFFYKYILLSLE